MRMTGAPVYDDHFLNMLSADNLQRPFAAGITLAGFTATSVDEFWLPTFIQSTAATVRKVGRVFHNQFKQC